VHHLDSSLSFFLPNQKNQVFNTGTDANSMGVQRGSNRRRAVRHRHDHRFASSTRHSSYQLLRGDFLTVHACLLNHNPLCRHILNITRALSVGHERATNPRRRCADRRCTHTCRWRRPSRVCMSTPDPRKNNFVFLLRQLLCTNATASCIQHEFQDV
jgi:hypothetical protein